MIVLVTTTLFKPLFTDIDIHINTQSSYIPLSKTVIILSKTSPTTILSNSEKHTCFIYKNAQKNFN